MNKTSKKLVLIELNELNFEFASAYAEKNNLKNLSQVLNGGLMRTNSEDQYEYLEPWVQWVSAHTGKTAAEHGIFRLGDIVQSSIPQYFEQVEAAGYSVGSVSAMNAANRLRNAAYFIPDPWTATATDGSFWSKALSQAVAQAVNDNAKERLTLRSVFTLIGGLARFARMRNYSQYIKLALKAKNASWRKALFLDLFLNDLHLHLFRSKRPNFSTVFLNAGAHIQHHYLLNARKVICSSVSNPPWYVDAELDPFEEMLEVYDRILGDYMSMTDVDLVVATGLTQRPYDREKFYWRLVDHRSFLTQLGVTFQEVFPRMTRDFLIEFKSVGDAKAAENALSNVVTQDGNVPLFGEIDNRGKSLFVTLTYPGNITSDMVAKLGNLQIPLRPHVAFVAIKNGMHEAEGFVFYKGQVKEYAAADGAHVKELYQVVMRYFGAETAISTPAQHLVPELILSELPEVALQ